MQIPQNSNIYIQDIYTQRIHMEDLFNQKVLCNHCNVQMQKGTAQKEGYTLRALHCPSCNKKVFHPGDLEELRHFQRIKEKEFRVKLRMVGNSYTISIPKEIINFQEEMQEEMEESIRMCLEEPEKLSIFFSKRLRKLY